MSKLVQCSQKSSHWYFDHNKNCPWCEIQTDCGIDIFPLIEKGTEKSDKNFFSNSQVQPRYTHNKTATQSKINKKVKSFILVALIIVSIFIGINNYHPINTINIPSFSLPVDINALNEQIQYGYDLYHEKHYSEALEKFRELNKNNLNEIDKITDKKIRYDIIYRIRSGMALSLWECGETWKALEILEDAEYYARKIGDDDRLIVVLNQLGEKYRVQKQYTDSYNAINQSLSIKETGNGYLQLALLYHDQNEFSKALSSVEKAIPLIISEGTFNPDQNLMLGKAWGLKSEMFFLLDRYDESIDAAHKGISYDPDNSDLSKYQGLSLFTKGEDSSALESLNNAIKLKNQDATLYHYKGKILEETGRYEEAKIAYNQAADLDSQYENDRRSLVAMV